MGSEVTLGVIACGRRIGSVLNRDRIVLAASVFLGITAALLNAQTAGTGRRPVFAQLESESPEARAAASSELLAHPRPENIPEIIRIVEKYLPDPERQGTVKDSMLLLGRFKAIEAIPLLVRNLTYEVFYKNTKRPQPPSDLFPAVQALIDIGAPSVRPVMGRLSAEDGEKLALAGASVLRGILGLDAARALLRKEIDGAADGPTRTRLQAVVHFVETAP
jgi:hypothetical protein